MAYRLKRIQENTYAFYRKLSHQQYYEAQVAETTGNKQLAIGLYNQILHQITFEGYLCPNSDYNGSIKIISEKESTFVQSSIPFKN